MNEATYLARRSSSSRMTDEKRAEYGTIKRLFDEAIAAGSTLTATRILQDDRLQELTADDAFARAQGTGMTLEGPARALLSLAETQMRFMQLAGAKRAVLEARVQGLEKRLESPDTVERRLSRHADHLASLETRIKRMERGD